MPTEPICSRRNQRPERRYPLAGFEVIIIGRFWVITEAEGSDFGGAAALPVRHHSR